MTVTIEEFKPIIKNSLLGFARVRLGNGMIFHDVPVCNSNGTLWASPASKPAITKEGTPLKGKGGKPVYTRVVTFATKELRDRFSTAVIDAMRVSYPEVF